MKLIEKELIVKGDVVASVKDSKIIFDPKSNLSRNEKLKMVISCIAENRAKQSRDKVELTIKSWNRNYDGEISIKAISRKTGMSRNTVKKYYYEIIESVK